MILIEIQLEHFYTSLLSKDDRWVEYQKSYLASYNKGLQQSTLALCDVNSLYPNIVRKECKKELPAVQSNTVYPEIWRIICGKF